MMEADLSLKDIVLEKRLAPAETVARAELIQGETGEPFDAVLTRLGLVSEGALAGAIAEATGFRLAGAADFPAEPLAADRLSPDFLRQVRCLVLADGPERAEVAFVDPLEAYARNAIAFALGKPIAPAIAAAADMEAALDRLFPQEFVPVDDGGEADEADVERLRDLSSDAPVVRAVNALIAKAAELKASDIHLEPGEDLVKVRFRIDGTLVGADPLPVQLKQAVVSRIKVMAGLNIAERRLPQDGRLRLAVRGHDIDLRVATSPTIHGEAVVLRLLDKSHLRLDFGALGFDEEMQERLGRVLRTPHGIVLVTGPTGSGKTTTLYAALAALNTPERKILTIEDPIEYRLSGINQTQAQPAIGLTFAAALRSFLRQDPDVMMVGEIRDLETAQVAVQAALTGHTVLSTVHTNGAAAAVTRLIDMGVEPFLITSTLNAVMAQRLVRRLCGACREPYAPGGEMQAALRAETGLDNIDRLWRPVGCPQCNHTGYSGRIAIAELLVVDESIERLILAKAEARQIAEAASLRTMMADGLAKARAGLTTVEEVLRVAQED
ncbi:MAG TPA: ATPase, T2SS/T4P/T4SS family [Caulobacteraceae bacterium]|nr:ATPase, T2SS/T4P/T4SS family [Caulobacteraceae bacterium]